MIEGGAIERGIVIGGVVQPRTEFVRRDSRAWWAPADSNDVRPRGGNVVTLGLGHWTGGHHRTGEGAGPAIVRAIEARTRADGSDMAVSCGFVISWDGLVWQTADMLDATIHVGDRRTYLRSVGIECAWAGTVENARRLGIAVGATVSGMARGQAIQCVAPSAELVAGWRALCNALTAIQHPAVAIPRRVVPYVADPKRGPDRGICEHRDVPSTLRKVDAAGLLVGALGW